MQTARWKLPAMVVLFAALAILPLVLVELRRNKTEDLPPSPRLIDPRQGGSPDHRERASAMIRAIAREDLAELLENLRSEDYLLYPGIPNERAFAQTNFEELIANRRFIRVLDLLESMPRPEAVRTVRQFAEGSIPRQVETFERIWRSYEDPDAPKNKVSMRGNQLAMCAALYLLGTYESTKSVLDQLTKIRESAKTLREDLKRRESLPEGLKHVMARFVEPDNAFVVSVLLDATQRDKSLMETQKNEIKSKAIGIFSVELDVTGWNADPGTYDFVYRFQGVPLDTSKGTRRFNVYQWTDELDNDRAKQSDVVAELLECADKVVIKR